MNYYKLCKGLSICLLSFWATASAYENNDPQELDLDQIHRKVGQSIIVGFTGTTPDDQEVNEICEQLKEGSIGGTILYHYKIVNPEQLIGLTDKLKQANPKAFIAVDQEGGNVSRLTSKKGFPVSIPSAYEIANSTDSSSETAKEKYFLPFAKQLKDQGFNTNFAPVVDLHDAESPAIGKWRRSFNADPQVVTDYARSFIEAHHDNNLLTALKHFPGHGLAKGDTHSDEVVDVTEFANPEKELLLYYQLMKEGKADMIMTAHVTNKKIDPDYPATLSNKIIPGLLRKEDSDIAVISDDLAMGAITKRYSSLQEVAKQAYAQATCDLLIISNNSAACKGGSYTYDGEAGKKVTEHLAQQIHTQKIPFQRLEESFRRVQNLKKRL